MTALIQSNIIESKNLRREFGHIVAVDNVSFSAARGDVLGFLGPNGAGKTTTMRMLTGFLTPSAGTALVSGHDILENPIAVRRAIGYLPENAPLYSEMEVLQFLSFIAEVRNLTGVAKKEAIERVVSATSLENVLYQQIETLSKGYKRRVGLAQALLHDPEVLIMDEPTDGLDPNQKHDVRALIHKMSRDKCIILSTHILEEVEEVCNRVVIISSGKVVADSTPNELRRGSKKHGAIVLSFAKSIPADAKKLLAAIKGVTQISLPEGDNLSNTLMLKPENSLRENAQSVLSAVLKQAEASGWQFSDVRIESGRLDDVFREITSGER